MRLPAEFVMISTRPSCHTATQLKVVPRSMPTAGASLLLAMVDVKLGISYQSEHPVEDGALKQEWGTSGGRVIQSHESIATSCQGAEMYLRAEIYLCSYAVLYEFQRLDTSGNH
jgi:hypothetical protein